MRGSEFKTLRENVHITQRELAEKVHKTTTTISRWESMEVVPEHAVYALRGVIQELTGGSPIPPRTLPSTTPAFIKKRIENENIEDVHIEPRRQTTRPTDEQLAKMPPFLRKKWETEQGS